MKRMILISAAVLLLGGLVSAVQAQDLIGTWQGTLSFVGSGGGTDSPDGYASGTASLHVTNQVAGLFMGYFLPPASGGDTNTVVGITQASILAPGSYDITLSISGGGERGGTATGQLTLTSPPKIWRIVYVRPGADDPQNPKHGVAAGGKLIRTSVTP